MFLSARVFHALGKTVVAAWLRAGQAPSNDARNARSTSMLFCYKSDPPRSLGLFAARQAERASVRRGARAVRAGSAESSLEDFLMAERGGSSQRSAGQRPKRGGSVRGGG